ncbi:DUF5994 family protein [Streptomyces sp. 6-11-2]|uniref:DUF5994 family protein n=1 Tax=Streptomyces sp. 6-11-2 TaxID=2585753 RepID=UPI0035A70DA0
MVTAIAGHRFRASLPSLITVLAEHLGFVTRFGLDAGVWEGLPTRLLVDDRVVHIDSLPVGDDTDLITRGDRDRFSLLVVSPDTPPDAARAGWPGPSGPTASPGPNRSSSTPAATRRIRRPGTSLPHTRTRASPTF